jgi:hypothetical protein
MKISTSAMLLMQARAVVKLQHHPLGQPGTAMGAPDQILILERGEIPPEGHLAHAESRGQFGDRQSGLRGQMVLNPGLASGEGEILHPVIVVADVRWCQLEV